MSVLWWQRIPHASCLSEFLFIMHCTLLFLHPSICPSSLPLIFDIITFCSTLSIHNNKHNRLLHTDQAHEKVLITSDWKWWYCTRNTQSPHLPIATPVQGAVHWSMGHAVLWKGPLPFHLLWCQSGHYAHGEANINHGWESFVGNAYLGMQHFNNLYSGLYF